jgi:hypothetical protein
MRGVHLLAVDLDGTLVDSAPDLAHCVDRALESLGLVPPGIDLTRAWIGDGIETLLRRALAHCAAPRDAATFRTVLERFSACYRDNLFVRSRLYPNVAGTLVELANRGIHLACVTNKRRAYADALLVEAGVRARFAVRRAGQPRAENRAPHSCWPRLGTAPSSPRTRPWSGTPTTTTTPLRPRVSRSSGRATATARTSTRTPAPQLRKSTTSRSSAIS